MKKLLFTLLVLITFSCGNNEDIDPDVNGSLSFVEGFIKENPEKVKLWQTTSSPVSTQLSSRWKSDVFLGFTFIPYKDIEITHIGSKIAREGIYEIDLILMDDIAIFQELDTLITNQINIKNTSEFQYNEVVENILLQEGKRYLIRYFTDSIEASYDIRINYEDLPVDEGEHFPHRLRTKDIKVKEVYIGKLGSLTDGTILIVSEEYTSGGDFLRGLPDFKYKIIN